MFCCVVYLSWRVVSCRVVCNHAVRLYDLSYIAVVVFAVLCARALCILTGLFSVDMPVGSCRVLPFILVVSPCFWPYVM